MNPILQALLNAAVTYLEDNPQEVELVATQLMAWLMSELKKALPAVAAADSAPPA